MFYKKLDHQIVNLIPGLHIKAMKKMGLHSSVPAIKNNEMIIQGSAEIMNYLDEQFPERILTPNDEKLRNETLEWEKYIDSEIGINVRLCVYHILLEHPQIVKSFFTHNGPWYGKLFLLMAFSKIKNKMRYLMKINDESAKKSKQALLKAVNKLNNHYQNNDFLVGEQFTRADLSAAALLAPLTMQPEYGLNWPKTIPIELQSLMNEFEGKIDWVDRFYKQHR